jgi:hypothetical protein
MHCSVFDIDLSKLSSKQIEDRCKHCLERDGETCKHIDMTIENLKEASELQKDIERLMCWIDILKDPKSSIEVTIANSFRINFKDGQFTDTIRKLILEDMLRQLIEDRTKFESL